MLFVHDHTFVNKDGNYYTTGSLNQQVMDRYKHWFGDIAVFATTRPANEKDAAYIRPENLVSIQGFHLVKKKNSLLHLFKIRKNLEADILSTDCVVIRMSIFGAIAAYYAKKHHVPYMVEMVACPWDSLWNHSLKGKILAPFMTLLTKSICKKAPRVLYVTNQFLQHRYPTNGEQIGCSDVELSALEDSVLEKRLQKIKNADMQKNPIKLCTVANVGVRYKGQDLVIRSLKELKLRGIDCEYYLVGGGNGEWLAEEAKRCGVEDKVHFVGPKPHEEIFEILDEMDIYIQPSLQEGLPRAVIEAMSRACPVVGSTTGGIPELISPSCVYKRGKQSDFVDTLVKLSNKDALTQNAKINFQKAHEYEKEALDKKRDAFYEAFTQDCKQKSYGG